MRRNLKIAGFVALLVTLGFLREFVFLNVNALLYYKYYGGSANENVSSAFAFLDAYSYRTLYLSKWFATAAFVFLFWLLQNRLIRFLFSEKKAPFWLAILYLSLLLLAGISFAAGWLFGNMDTGYRFSRMFMGLVQSPVPCMVIIPLTYFYKKTEPPL